MDDAVYCAEILAAYEGEVGGEITSATLLQHLALDEVQTFKLELLRRVEAQIGTALAPVVERLGLEPADFDDIATRARNRALRVKSWEALISHFGSQLEHYVARFVALRRAARPGDEAVLDLLVAHEEALIRFGQLEAAGNEAGAMACLLAAVG